VTPATTRRPSATSACAAGLDRPNGYANVESKSPERTPVTNARHSATVKLNTDPDLSVEFRTQT
jgi:hypothetical protein